MPLTVKDIMSRIVQTISEQSTVMEASVLMAKKGISSLLVKRNGEIAGILTERDIVIRSATEDLKPSEVVVREIMSSPIITVNEGESLSHAVNVMISNDIKKLPVVTQRENREIVGIISMYDVGKYQPELISSTYKIHDEITQQVKHDLRGALFTLNTSVVLMEKSPEKMPHFLEIMKKSLKYMEGILEEWKKGEGKLQINRETFRMSDLVNLAVKTVFIPHGIKISTSTKDEGTAYLDYNKMMRVLSNLIKNSVEAIDDEGSIDITTILSGEGAVLKVKDTGHGIKPEIIERIFDPMFSTKPTGLGLGLAYVKNVVEAHGGKVHVCSEVGKGAEFTLLLPAYQKGK